MTPEEAKTSGLGDRDVTESSSGLGAVVRQMPKWEERCGEYRTENHGKEICCKERQRKAAEEWGHEGGFALGWSEAAGHAS